MPGSPRRVKPCRPGRHTKKRTESNVKTRRIILIYWFLLIVPTLVIGIWALKLLSHEQDRLKAQALSALTQRAESMAETLEITVAEVAELMGTITYEVTCLIGARVDRRVIAGS